MVTPRITTHASISSTIRCACSLELPEIADTTNPPITTPIAIPRSSTRRLSSLARASGWRGYSARWRYSARRGYPPSGRSRGRPSLPRPARGRTPRPRRCTRAPVPRVPPRRRGSRQRPPAGPSRMALRCAPSARARRSLSCRVTSRPQTGGSARRPPPPVITMKEDDPREGWAALVLGRCDRRRAVATRIGQAWLPSARITPPCPGGPSANVLSVRAFAIC